MRKLNNQKKLPVDKSYNYLRVKKIFKTIQGEGPYSGRRALFIRLFGCNLQCPFCDTDYTGNNYKIAVPPLLEHIRSIWDEDELIVITGGEPFRQTLVWELIDELSPNYMVQIETNGTLPIKLRRYASIVCSPKTPTLHPGAVDYIDHYKYVIEKGRVSNVDGLPTVALGLEHSGEVVARPPDNHRGNVYIQPLDTGVPTLNRRNLEECVRIAQEYGYIIQQQLHKQIGVE